MTLRSAVPEDAAEIAELGGAAFYDGWAALIGVERATAYGARFFTPECLLAEMADSANFIIVARCDEKLAGFLTLLSEAIPPLVVSGPRPILLQRLYVAAAFRGTGVADALFRACIVEAKQQRAETMWLECHPGNPRAWRYYLQRGFQEAGEVMYDLGSGDCQQTRALQRPVND